mmetsp:Transcript_16839/g.24976  ORF Transcript_16839/g.24976 Transcript_16839/m.24976 type:complete len:90 (-) Transcript_16839:316-585(-)
MGFQALLHVSIPQHFHSYSFPPFATHTTTTRPFGCDHHGGMLSVGGGHGGGKPSLRVAGHERHQHTFKTTIGHHTRTPQYKKILFLLLE